MQTVLIATKQQNQLLQSPYQKDRAGRAEHHGGLAKDALRTSSGKVDNI